MLTTEFNSKSPQGNKLHSRHEKEFRKRKAVKIHHNQIQNVVTDPLSTISKFTYGDIPFDTLTSRAEEAELSPEYYATVSTVCRACLQALNKDFASTSTIPTHHEIFQTPNLVKRLCAFTSLKIEQTDKYPKNLCSKCFSKVNEFYQFQSMCVESMQQFCQTFLTPADKTTFDVIVPRIKTEISIEDTFLQSEAVLGDVKADTMALQRNISASKMAGQTPIASSDLTDNHSAVLHSKRGKFDNAVAIVQCSAMYSDEDSLLEPLHVQQHMHKEKLECMSVKSKLCNDSGHQQTIEDKLDELLRSQMELQKIVTENTVLLRHNFGVFSALPIKFPLESAEKLEELEAQLNGEKKEAIIGALRRITGGQIEGIDAIFGRHIIMAYNYDGTKDKKALKAYKNCLDAIYEATLVDGRSFDEFKSLLRQHFRKAKNRFHKQNHRNKIGNE